jgi:hypothetical protein
MLTPHAALLTVCDLHSSLHTLIFVLGDDGLLSLQAVITFIRQANTVDAEHFSSSYELRLAKYASRGFEIYIPELRRD